MSWEEVHRLELHLRARAGTIGSHASGSSSRCPGCGKVVEDDQGGMKLGGVTVHLGCLPALRPAPQNA